MKGKIWIGLLIGVVLFLFLAIKFNRIEKSELVKNNIDYDWVELNRVIDGDTIEVKIGEIIESVRLIGIDAPEMEEKTQQKAIISKNYLENLLLNKKIRLEKDETQNDRDIYQRLLRYVFLEDGTLINKKMIEANMADEYTFKIPYKYQTEFKELESLETRN